MPGTLEDYAAAVNHAISACRDAEQGFRGAAESARDAALREMFEQFSTLHGRFAAELQEGMKALGLTLRCRLAWEGCSMRGGLSLNPRWTATMRTRS